MKKNSLLIAMLFLLIACSGPVPEKRENESIPVFKTTKGLSNDELFQKLKDVRSTASELWNTCNLADTFRQREIKNLINYVSFMRVTSASRGSIKSEPFETGYVTTFILLVCSPEQLDQVFNNTNSSSGNKLVMAFRREDATLKDLNLPPDARQILIYANSNYLNENSVHSLALTLIHELNHVYQYIYLANIPEDQREPDAFNVQLRALKNSLNPSELKIFEKNVVEQKKVPYNFDNSLIKNKKWLKDLFGQVNFYVDLFLFDCYGYDTVFKEFYEKSKK